MADLVVTKDVLAVMHPAVFLAHHLSSGHGDRFISVLRLIWLNLVRQLTLLIFTSLSDLMATNWHEFGSVVDSRNLSSQVMFLLAEVEGVGNDVSLKVSSEADLDLTGSLKITRLEVGKTRPWALSFVGNEVRVLVHARAASFATFRSGILTQVFGLKDLSDVVISLCAGNLTPESKRASISRLSKSLDRLLKNERAVFSDLNTSLVKDMLVQSADVLDETKSGTCGFFIITTGSSGLARSLKHLSELSNG